MELFFDLIFVFALIQLSHHLAEHLTWRGAAENATLLIGVLSVWSYTSWAATMIPVHRGTSTIMLLVVTLLGLMMNASIGAVFSDSAWSFVIPMLVIQVGRTIWTINNSPTTEYKQHFKALTGTSPLQYLKNLRLQEARDQMLLNGLEANQASGFVGYESASQFSREYSRLFGLPPQKDIQRLRQV